jgi:hypothetical protein
MKKIFCLQGGYMEFRDMCLIAAYALCAGFATLMIGAMITAIRKNGKRKAVKKRGSCSTVGKGVAGILLAYACIVAFFGTVCLFAFMAEADTFVLLLIIVAYALALAVLFASLLCYRYKGGSVSWDENEVVLKLPGQDELVIVHPSELYSVMIDPKGGLVVSLRDGNTYALGRMVVTIHEFLAFAAKYTG